MVVPLLIKPPENLLAKMPELGSMARKLSLCYAYRYAVSEAQLQTMGRALWQALAVDESKFQHHISQATAVYIPIIIQCADPAIQHLPWECLHHPVLGFLGIHPNFTLSRQLFAENTTTTTTVLDKGPLRVLLFTSLPDDLDAEFGRLDTEAEQTHVLEALLPWIQQGQVILETPDDGRFSTLQRRLHQGRFHLVFLSGHGRFHHQPHELSAYGEFLFESETGQGEMIRDRMVAEAFVNSGVQCVVLSTCESGKMASTTLTAGLAQQLQHVGLPHVIGMREAILDRAGILFARAFCDAVGQQKTVDVALQQARRAMTQPSLEVMHRSLGRESGAELSVTQWCLPMLYSQHSGQALIDWDFTPKTQAQAQYHRQLEGIPLPEVFIGRRRELRQLGPAFYTGKTRHLLLTGPGGQGKTTLAGQLAWRMQAQGYLVCTYLAHKENDWDDFLFNLEFSLDTEQTQAYKEKQRLCDTPAKQAKVLLRLLIQQTQYKLLLFFDNLDAIQQPESRKLSDPRVQTWIDTILAMGGSGPRLLLTSRWKLPDWPESGHHALSKPSYGDFLRYVPEIASHTTLENWLQLREIYTTLGGNFRGLAFFLYAEKAMRTAEKQDFLRQLAQAQEELQTNMAIARVYALLSPPAQIVLHRLCAYTVAVPWDGVAKITLDLAKVQTLLAELTAYSLTETSFDEALQRLVFQNNAQVGVWLQQKAGKLAIEWYRLAAEYQVYLFATDRRIETQALAAHQALVNAGRQNEANTFARDYLIQSFTLRGLYHALLNIWLPPLRASEDQEMRAYGLNQTGKIYLHIGNYDAALRYLQQSLVIRKAIGDKKGEGIVLNNISQAYQAQGDYDTALDCLQQSLAMQRAIGDRQHEGTTLNNIAQIYQVRGDYNTALDYLQQSLLIATTIDNKLSEGTALNNISQIYQSQGDYDIASDYLQQSLAILKATGDKQGEGTTLNNMAQIYQTQGDHNTALDYLQQSLIIRKAIGDKQGEGATLNNIAQIYQAQGDCDTALDCLQQSLTIRKAIGDKQGEGTTLNNIAQIYQAQGGYDTALDYLQQSLTLRKKIGDLPGLCTTQFNIGMNQLQQKQTQAAFATWASVYQTAKQINEFQVLQALEKLAKQLGEEGLSYWESLSQQPEASQKNTS